MKSVLLVHGAWHGAWCWHRVLDGLRSAGIRARVTDLVFLCAVMTPDPHVPSTYVVCEHDRAIPASLQRVFAANAGTVHEWPTSHSPFFSAPDRVVDLLGALATA